MKLLTNLVFEPKGAHDPAQAYAIKDTVMSADGSRVYFALQDVPAGVALTDAAYWIRMIDLSASSGTPSPVLTVNGRVGDITLTAPDVGAASEEALSTKLNSSFETLHAGKLLYIGADGNVTVLKLGAGLAVVNGALTVIASGAASTASICGESTCGNNTICGGN